MATEQNLYDLLGVGEDATTREIRAAYRSMARRFHPDMDPAGTLGGSRASEPPSMAEINHAWHVLSDRERRMHYDRTRRSPVAEARVGPAWNTEAPMPRSISPARFPWRAMLALAGLGAVVVLVADATTSPTTPQRPDQLLQSGSCVVVDERSEVFEVSCQSPHDGVVRQLIALDRPCPVGTEAHRDRQGMGLACIDRVQATTES